MDIELRDTSSEYNVDPQDVKDLIKIHGEERARQQLAELFDEDVANQILSELQTD